MAPKVKVTREDVVLAALSLVREGGEEAVNARSIAAMLGCSTQPIFSNFPTMDALLDATLAAAYERYSSYLVSEMQCGRYPKYKAFGMAYVRFAKEESALFRMLFMRDRRGADLSPTEDFSLSVEMLVSTLGISAEQAERMHIEMWCMVHGIATMLATSFLELPWDAISEMLSDVYNGLRMRFLEKEGTV